MSLLASYPGLLPALAGEMTPKFLATRSADGHPNVVPVTSIMPAGDVPDRLIFGNFLLRKSIANLDADPRVGILVITTDLEGWMLQGDFQGWQRAGAYVDQIMNTALLRYNAYTGIRNAGIIQVRAVQRQVCLSRLRVLTDYAVARLAARLGSKPAGATPLPPVVRQHFRPMMAVRALAFLDDTQYMEKVAQSGSATRVSGWSPSQAWQTAEGQGASGGLQTRRERGPLAQSGSATRVSGWSPSQAWQTAEEHKFPPADTGYPVVVPALSLQPAAEDTLVCAEGLVADLLAPLPADAPVAASLLTLDVVSFQAKGRWLGSRRLLGQPVGAMAVTAVYAGGPPIPGRQVA